MSAKRRFTRQRGIAIGPILFVVAILAVLVGALAAGSNSFTSSTSDDSNRVIGSTIIQQGNSLKSGFDRILINGTAASSVIISTNFTGANASTNMDSLYTPTGGGLTVQQPPANAVAASANWRFVPDANLPGIGTSGANDYIAVIQVRNEAVCMAINSVIFGRDSALATSAGMPVVAAAGITLNDVTTALGVAASANAFDASGESDVNGRTQACVGDGAGTELYYYYQLLYAG